MEDRAIMFRRFGEVHLRVLLDLQAEIEVLEMSLFRLDEQDYKHPEMHYRLHDGEHEESWDPAKKNILGELQTKLRIYGE
jgi:hypothetical protein